LQYTSERPARTRGGEARPKARGRGSIVNISSGAGRSYSLTSIQAYASAKVGLLGLTRQTARELGPHGIRVNCFFASDDAAYVVTTVTPLGKWRIAVRSSLGGTAIGPGGPGVASPS
jgi:NAD(P)-dependent dehydrogenase (short-subunit alcohol dehydrogenase family)